MNRPRLAVVGVGYMGELHAQKLSLLAAENRMRFVGIYDADRARAEAVAKRYAVPLLADLEAVSAEADGAIVAVPTFQHEPVGVALLRGGVDLLMEKPLAATREAGRALLEAARSNQRRLQVGHIERFSEALLGALPIVKRPRFIEVHRIGPYSARGTDVSVVLDLMIHDLDIVALLTNSEVERIDAIGIPVLSATEDIANARVRFCNGCVLNITASRVSLERMRKVRVFQADAYLSIDLGSQRITLVRRRMDEDEGRPVMEVENLEFDAADALLAQDRSFVEVVAGNGTPVVSGEDGFRALDLALRIQAEFRSPEELA